MEKKIIRIAHAIDAAVAHHAAKEMAVWIGFDEQEAEEIAIVISELASNQFTHAQGGTIRIEPAGGEQPGIQVEAVDSGPGIANVEQALADGFSTAGGLGLGLGSVNRLMDQLEIASQPGQGTQISCTRWLRPKYQGISSLELDIGVASRPFPGMVVNGDAFVVKQWDGHALVGVIDGLGHGQYANLAAETARRYVETHADQPLDALFRGTARACLATRGVVMALAHFDILGQNPETNMSPEGMDPTKKPVAPIKFSFASLGNIEVRLIGSPEPVYFNLRRGVVGLNAPNAVVTRHAWTEECILILHSDGLTTHWQPKEFPNLSISSAGQLAQELINSLAKEEDDATVIVVKTGRKDRIH
jgi:anti-sigma regulatory factor (Ser/Thr protein kinase)/serine/threonine protein phosphatase PrpC